MLGQPAGGKDCSTDINACFSGPKLQQKLLFDSCAYPEREQGPGPHPPGNRTPLPLENHKAIGFLSNTDPDPLEAFDVGPLQARERNAI